jgi:hypothetical protein
MGGLQRISCSLRRPPAVPFKLQRRKVNAQAPARFDHRFTCEFQLGRDLLDTELVACQIPDITIRLHGPSHQFSLPSSRPSGGGYHSVLLAHHNPTKAPRPLNNTPHSDRRSAPHNSGMKPAIVDPTKIAIHVRIGLRPEVHFFAFSPRSTNRRGGATRTCLRETPAPSARARTATTVRSRSAAMSQAFIPDITNERSRSSSVFVQGFL